MTGATPTDAEVTNFISELLATAEDEANDITDIPVDDILNKAADLLHRMRDQVRVYKNGYDQAMFLQARMEADLQYAQECNDKLSNDVDAVISALAEHGYTEWVDSEGIIRPIPLAWPLHPDNEMREGDPMTFKHKMLMSKHHPPRLMNPRPDDMLALEEDDRMRALMAWRPPVIGDPSSNVFKNISNS